MWHVEPAKTFDEGVVVEAQQLAETMGRPGTLVGPYRGEPGRTGGQTVVTAVDPPLHQRTDPSWYRSRALQPGRDAAPRIETILGDCPCRTGRHTCNTGPAATGHGRGWLKVGVGGDGPDEQPGSVTRGEEHRALPEPPHTGPCCRCPVYQPVVVDQRLSAMALPGQGFDDATGDPMQWGVAVVRSETPDDGAGGSRSFAVGEIRVGEHNEASRPGIGGSDVGCCLGI